MFTKRKKGQSYFIFWKIWAGKREFLNKVSVTFWIRSPRWTMRRPCHFSKSFEAFEETFRYELDERRMWKIGDHWERVLSVGVVY
jgi:hypothetical protein